MFHPDWVTLNIMHIQNNQSSHLVSQDVNEQSLLLRFLKCHKKKHKIYVHKILRKKHKKYGLIFKPIIIVFVSTQTYTNKRTRRIQF